MATRKRSSKATAEKSATAKRGSRKTAAKKSAAKRVRKAPAESGSALVDVARSIGSTLGKVTVKTREMTEKTREVMRGKI